MTSRTSRVIWNAPAGDKTLPSASDALLTAANADACAQRRELRRVAVATKPEVRAGKLSGELARRAKASTLAVEADRAMMRKVGDSHLGRIGRR